MRVLWSGPNKENLPSLGFAQFSFQFSSSPLPFGLESVPGVWCLACVARCSVSLVSPVYTTRAVPLLSLDPVGEPRVLQTIVSRATLGL